MTEPIGNLNSIADARARFGGICNATIYNWIRDGRLRAIKLGTRTFITDAEIERFLHEANTEAAERAVARRGRRGRDVREPAREGRCGDR